MSDVCSARRAADIAGVPLHQIYNWERIGKIQHRRPAVGTQRMPGKPRVFFSASEVAAFAAAARARPEKQDAKREPACRQARTHCARGHAMTGDNVISSSSGGRACRECARRRAKQQSQRRTAAARGAK